MLDDMYDDIYKLAEDIEEEFWISTNDIKYEADEIYRNAELDFDKLKRQLIDLYNSKVQD